MILEHITCFLTAHNHYDDDDDDAGDNDDDDVNDDGDDDDDGDDITLPGAGTVMACAWGRGR